MRYIVPLFIIVLMLACEEDNQPIAAFADGSAAEFPEVDVWLTIIDSIGVETGDSNMILGRPVVSVWMPDDRIAVLDLQKCRVSVFSSNGNYLTSVGRQGSGPGEFLVPSWLSLTPSGGLGISDGMAGSVFFFDSALVYTGKLDGFFPSPPTNTVFLNDTVFAGIMPDYEMNDDNITAGFSVALWSTSSTDPETFYYRDLVPFNPEDIFSLDATMPIFTMSPDGIVYTSVKSTEEYVIHCMDTDGTKLFTVTEPFTRVPRTQEEIQQELEHMQSLIQGNALESLLDSFEPETYRYSISSMSIGPDGNLWVGQGIYRHPVFRIYDPQNGDYLFTAALDSTEKKSQLLVMMNRWGITAMNTMSDQWPRIYILQVKN
ncbi:MAG: 6-bladed beta-propeller [Candidatus Aegiribacteria sp.]|nr:6-bladed beta-propeller [Candidatus Aegiribacteria sp.]